MSYDNSMNFGYDQIFVNPLASSYRNYPAPTNNRSNIESDLIKKINEMETSGGADNRSFVENKPTLGNYSGYNLQNNVHGECNCRNCTKSTDVENLKQAIFDLQRKNDMLIMFIAFVFIFVIMQYNTLNYGMHYANTLSMAKVVPPTS